MSWDLDKAGSQGTNSEDKQAFTKFPEGITRITVLGDAPHVRWTHWQPRFMRSINCPGKGCPICEIRKREKANGAAYTHAMGRRFTLDVWNHETNQYEIMDQGKTFMEDLRDVREDIIKSGKNFNAVTLDVKRRGLDKDNTKYRIDASSEALPVPNHTPIDIPEFFKAQTPEQILELLNVPNGSKEEMLDAWIRITTGAEINTEPEEIELA